MNQLKIIYQKLEKREVELGRENQRLELLFRQEKRFLKDGRERKLPVRSVEQIFIHFWNGIEIKDINECWNWKRSVNIKSKCGIGNYGIMWIYGRKYKTHRLSYVFCKGEIGRFFVCHKCDNPQCCNPHHLFLGTAKDNTRDCVSKGRANNERGENRYCSKLTEDAVRDIRKNYIPKIVTHLFFMKKYNVSMTAIHNVLKKNRWKHVE